MAGMVAVVSSLFLCSGVVGRDTDRIPRNIAGNTESFLPVVTQRAGGRCCGLLDWWLPRGKERQ